MGTPHTPVKPRKRKARADNAAFCGNMPQTMVKLIHHIGRGLSYGKREFIV